ncbi:FlgO family outer membrane protein [Nitrincola nitratireducens]|uniref:FlgO domain-containing protein n=1 Tax=Nitrincola nitratireducens TaxID=1229521 RepID=W9V5C5_9GAMM|nr:FlgO family outer membrane protein [Nitrincola nitratireducens]EXJ12136.1 hypothetical protein D791_01025 [Nitrincola nitratireducens]
MKRIGIPSLPQAAILFLVMLFAVGCSSNRPVNAASQDVQVDVVGELRKASKHLFAVTAPLDISQPVLTASFASIDDLQQSSTFGRQAAEVFTSELARTGVPVVEVKMRDSLFIQERTGELMLSRELRHLSSSHNAQAVLVGTYAVGGTHLYVNVRVVRTADNVILGSHNFSLPINRDIRSMLPRR